MAREVLLRIRRNDVVLTLWTNGNADVTWSNGFERYECPGQLALRWIPATDPIASDVLEAIRLAREELRRMEDEDDDPEEEVALLH